MAVVLYSFFLVLLFLVLFGAGYAVAGRLVLARFGRAGVAWLLLLACIGPAVFVLWRVRASQETATYRPFVDHPIWMTSTYAAFLLITLLPLTWRMLRWQGAGTPMSSASYALRAVPLTFLGILIALATFIVLDVVGVPFLPPSVTP
jgi:hypothetical protein